jgi:hypothetical protein
LAGWPVELVELVELAADNGSIAGADYDPVADRYEPGQGGRALGWPPRSLHARGDAAVRMMGA